MLDTPITVKMSLILLGRLNFLGDLERISLNIDILLLSPVVTAFNPCETAIYRAKGKTSIYFSFSSTFRGKK